MAAKSHKPTPKTVSKAQRYRDRLSIRVGTARHHVDELKASGAPAHVVALAEMQAAKLARLLATANDRARG